MAIADILGYEVEIEHVLLDNKNKETGVKVWVKGLDCQDAVYIEGIYNRRAIGDRIARGEKPIDPEFAGNVFMDLIRDQYLSCISRWDFGGEELFDGEGPPVCDYETKLRFYALPVFGEQVRKWVDDIGDFTKS